jgi:UDP-N-acetylmuramate dehydrogenase
VVGVEVLERVAAALGVAVDDVPRWPAAEGQVKLPAAWLLEKAGFVKGFVLGHVGISSRHTLALINRGHATAADVVALRERIRGVVMERFGIALEQEPVQPGS